MNEASATEGHARPSRSILPSTWQRHWSVEAGLQLALGILLIGALLLFYGQVYPLHHDLAGSLLSGRLAVALGERFRDYSIYFPPAEKAWFTTAARVSDMSGLRPDLAIAAMTGVAILISTGLAYRIRRASVGASPFFLLGSLAVLVLLPILFKNVFGLREHLVALGLWPYLVRRVSDPEGTRTGPRLRAIVGIWLGATLLFKYLYSIVVLLVEVADSLARRRPALWFRFENLVAGAIVFLYLFLWLGIHPAERQAIGAMLSAIDSALADQAKNWWEAATAIYFCAFFLLAARIFRIERRLIFIGAALVLGAILTAWAQQRWSSHHVFPITLAYIAWWWMVGDRFKWWAHAVVALFLVAPITDQFRGTIVYRESVDELDAAVAGAGQSVTGKRVGILTMHPSPYNQYLASHRALRWNSMMNNAYVSSELAPLDVEANDGKLAPPVTLADPGRRMLHDEMLRLWEDMPPDVLILDHSYRWPLHYLDVRWERVFANDARFKAILSHYRPVIDHHGNRLEFKYYVRTD